MASLAALALGGCASGEVSPLGESARALIPGGSDYASEVQQHGFAALIVDAANREGMAVLGAMAGPYTYWPTGDGGSLALFHGALHSTSGFDEDLLGTQYRLEGVEVPWLAETPVAFELSRQWQVAGGAVQQQRATGRLECAPAEPVSLTLDEPALERCNETLEWDDGTTTRSTLWREPHTHQLRQVAATPWPGAPTFAWQVARSWW
ncbi:hypothetical protein BWR19_10180 [Halomonas sp. 1513]|nr:YjbF family lipoprotein [Halomonas sp. 1513]APX93266.1 hypothetical protein BWR19_10180 [Halomonas sp. 1513]